MMLPANWAAARRSSRFAAILRDGTSAERQLRVFKETGDLKEVVKPYRGGNTRRCDSASPAALAPRARRNGLEKRLLPKRRISAERDAYPERRARQSKGTETMKIGILCGREYSFPPAFIDKVNELGKTDDITR